MAGHTKFSELEKRMSPESRQRVLRRTQEALEEMLFTELRKAAGLAQPDSSRTEEQDDLPISALRGIVEALGGELEIVAHLPTGRITVSPLPQRDPVSMTNERDPGERPLMERQ